MILIASNSKWVFVEVDSHDVEFKFSQGDARHCRTSHKYNQYNRDQSFYHFSLREDLIIKKE
jgi:hypothetical protein